MLANSSQVRRKLSGLGLWVLMIVILIIVMIPIFWVVITSFKKPLDSLDAGIIPWIQFEPTLNNWKEHLNLASREIGAYLTNSIVVALINTSIALFLGSMAGYALARLKYKFGPMRNKDICTWILSQIIVPPVVIVIPFFIVIKSMGLIDTRVGLSLAHSIFSVPLAVLLMRDAFLGLPVELEEQGMIDGLSRFGSFVRIALPLSTPALISTSILCFAFSWNEFLYALTLTYQKSVTIPLFIAGARQAQGIKFWTTSVRVLVGLLPPAILALFIQKFLVKGLTFGALK